jgi:hypothetical protein
MSGVVYAIGCTIGTNTYPPGLLGKFGVEVQVSGTVPPGEYYMGQTFTVTDSSGEETECEAGYCMSDGFSVQSSGTAIPVGAGKEIVWPWPKPWPLTIFPPP